MGFDAHFTPPGDVDSTWTEFPARSHCCPDITSVRVSLLVMGADYPITYDPDDEDDNTRVAGLNALFDATDPKDLGVGFWIVRWNFALETPAAEIIDGSVSGYFGAQHFDGTGTPPTIYLGRAKLAVQFGWEQPGGTPAWREIDGPTVTVSYNVRTYTLDALGNLDSSSVGDLQTIDLDIAPDDIETWSEWVDFPEPEGNFAVRPVRTSDADTDDYPAYAYATRDCLGD